MMQTIDENTTLNLEEAVEISADTYWIGRRDGSLLERNIYLRVFKGGGKQVNMIIDPGPPEDLMTITKKVSPIIGPLRNVNLVFLNHQDPDVGYNAGYLQKMNPNLYVLCSEDTWRLVRFYDLKSSHYKAVEKFKYQSVSLSTGHMLHFVPTPFCHFRGAMMLYDRETRILYTGDLFGGLSYKPDLIADDSYWEGLKTFHQIYMPIQDGLRLAVQNIRKINPAPLVIAPQHGSIITGDRVGEYLDRMETLEVGLNLLLDSQRKENHIAALNELVLELSPVIGKEALNKALQMFEDDNTFPHSVKIEGAAVVDIKVDLETAVNLFVKSLLAQAPGNDDLIEMAVLKIFLGRNIPLPDSFKQDGMESPDFFEEEPFPDNNDRTGAFDLKKLLS